MNIGQLMRTVLNDMPALDSKTLELKIGQIVRGVILQLLEEQDALVNINGSPVRARLETPLRPGQATLLQVQPESSDGQIVLKPLTSSNVQISGDSMPQVMQSLGMKDSPKLRQLVNQIHQQGVSLTKANVQQMLPVLQAVPAGVAEEEWIQSAVIAFGRGLPLSEETVGAIHRAVFGLALQGQLSELAQSIGRVLSDAPGNGAAVDNKASPPMSASTSQVLSRLGQLLGQIRQEVTAQAATWTGETTDHAPPVPQGPAIVSSAQPADGARRLTNAAPGPSASNVSGNSPEQQAAGKGQETSSSRTADNKTTIPRSRPPSEMNHSSVAAKPAAAPEPGSSRVAEGEKPSPAGRASDGHAASERSAKPQEGAWIPKLYQSLGIDHENQMMKWLDSKGEFKPDAASTGLLNMPAEANEAEGGSNLQDSVKSLLLQLSSAVDVPPAIKEQLQQTLQQLTGQQLLLSADRGQLFTHITLMLPLFHGSDGQTASVHVQSRRNRKGTIDSDNCRLLFDLRMKSLGDTLVDVQIVNKLVSLTVHNDYPSVGQLFELSRPEVAGGLQQAGYHFVSLNCKPFPKPEADNGVRPSEPDMFGGLDARRTNASSLYRPKPYKGVDVRV